jgi:hypothetical protein
MTTAQLVTEVSLSPGSSFLTPGAEPGELLRGITEWFAASHTECNVTGVVALNGNRTGAGQGLHAGGAVELVHLLTGDKAAVFHLCWLLDSSMRVLAKRMVNTAQTRYHAG